MTQVNTVSVAEIIGALPKHAWFHVAAIVSGLLLGLLGPFGTFASITNTDRLIFWVGLCWLNANQTTLIAGWLGTRLESRLDQGRYLLCLAITALINSVPGTLEVWLGLYWITDTQTLDIEKLPTLYLQTTLITAILTGFFMLLVKLRMATATTPIAKQNTQTNPTHCPFLQRIPAKIRGQLLAVSAEDHYMRIVTDQGEALVHGRLGDALEELADYPGLQIHRSHWVALSAIDDVKRNDGKTLLRLTNGTELPISRRYSSALRELGW